MATTLTRLEFRRRPATQWTSLNEVLLDGEPGVESDTGKWKIGNGTTGWNALTYQPFSADITAQITAAIDGFSADIITTPRLHAANLLDRLSSPNLPAIPAVVTGADAPTVTVGTTVTVTGGQVIGPQTAQITEIGSRGTWNNTFGGLTAAGFGSHTGIDFFHTGTTVEIAIAANSGSGLNVWTFVNGAPIAAAPVATGALGGAGTVYYYKLVFPTAARRRIELFADPVLRWFRVYAPYSDLITAAPRRPVICLVGDSFFAGAASSPVLQSQAFIIARSLGVEAATVAYGGTGYANAGSFTIYGSPARINLIAAFQPELVVIQGSVNDDSQSPATVQANASAFYSALATRLPGTKIIVFGPQPNAASATLSAARVANVQAVAAAAAAAPNVIAFHDQIGVAGNPPAWSSATTYSDGATVTRNGSVYQLDVSGGTSVNDDPVGSSGKWSLLTYTFTGTGSTGAVTGNGTRDFFLFSDGVHPTVTGADALGLRVASVVRGDLLTAAS